ASGATQEKVFDVAGGDDGATVDIATCAASGGGRDALCAVWEDPEFDPGERAFYYARVLEDPVCRWSTRLCNAQGIDCSDPASVPRASAPRCDPRSRKRPRGRAGPPRSGYRPGGTAGARGGARYGRRPGSDVLSLPLRIEPPPATFDPVTTALRVTV